MPKTQKPIKGLGMPYKGSKRKIAHKIVDYITSKHEVEHFYDLFGGGGAVSLYAAQVIPNVIYNDIDTQIAALLEYSIKYGATRELLDFVDRETFFKYKDHNSIYGAFVSLVYSFSQGMRSYLYSRTKEPKMKEYHNMLMKEYIDFEGMIKAKNTLHMRLRHLESINTLNKIYKANVKLTLTSRDYKEIDPYYNKTVVYIDPPYAGTHKYNNDVNHAELKEYIHSLRVPVYVSGYNNDYGLQEALSIPKRKTFSAYDNSTIVQEKLFWNEIE